MPFIQTLKGRPARTKKQTRRRRIQQKGGEKYMAGVDACIFNPIVECKEGEIPPDLIKGSVSRIIPSSSKDIEYEKFIFNHFPDLVNRNLVVVGKHYCTPKFKRTNLNVRNNEYPFKYRLRGRPCSAISTESENNYTNIITKFFEDGGLLDHINKYKIPLETSLKIAKPAILAAVSLVPDNGPWAVHADCHLNNIYVSNMTSAIGDWGRCILIENPNNYKSIRTGFQNYFETLQMSGLLEKDDFEHAFEKLLARGMGSYKQHPKNVLELCQRQIEMFLKANIKDKNVNTKINNIQGSEMFTCLRGWVPYVLLTQLFELGATSNSRLDTLLSTKNQSELRNAINTSIEPFIKEYLPSG